MPRKDKTKTETAERVKSEKPVICFRRRKADLCLDRLDSAVKALLQRAVGDSRG